jgi:type IV secretory pathway VirB2 component (pilin)
MDINFSRIIAILSFVVTGATLLLGVLGSWLPPDYSLLILGITAAISAFVERVQGHPED